MKGRNAVSKVKFGSLRTPRILLQTSGSGLSISRDVGFNLFAGSMQCPACYDFEGIINPAN
jgi:hypothetical protein